MVLGGFGFLSRLHGLSVDNLVEAEVVLADGRIVIVNEKENQGGGSQSLYPPYKRVLTRGKMETSGGDCAATVQRSVLRLATGTSVSRPRRLRW